MGILQYDSKGMTQVVFFDLINVNAVVADLAILNIVEPLIRFVIVVFPAPVLPTKAIFCPGVAKRSTLCRTILSGLYPKSTSSNTTSPFN